MTWVQYEPQMQNVIILENVNFLTNLLTGF